MNSSPTRLPTPEGPGSVSGAPHLPDGFTGTFTSRYIDTGGLRDSASPSGAPIRVSQTRPAAARPMRRGS